jgi:hypothetical protein
MGENQMPTKRKSARAIKKSASDTRRITAPEAANTEADEERKWEDSFAKSPDVLSRLVEKARQDYKEGRTVELDPDDL